MDLSLSGTRSLGVITANSPKGPPGKFYQERWALALLNTLRTGGSSARVVPAHGADENQIQHFERFRARLEAGELVRRSLRLIRVPDVAHDLYSLSLWRASSSSRSALQEMRSSASDSTYQPSCWDPLGMS